MPIATSTRLDLAVVTQVAPNFQVRPTGSNVLIDIENNFAGDLNIGDEVLFGVDEAGRQVILAQTGSGQAATLPIQTGDIAAAAITRELILEGAIDRTRIAQGEVTAALIALDAITDVHISPGGISAPSIAANSITGYHVVAGSISADHIAAYSISAINIAAQSITAGHILTGTITADQIFAGTITSNEIQTGTLTSASGVFGAISADDITTGTLSADVISVNTINANRIITDTITTLQMGPNSVTGGSSGFAIIAPNTVMGENIQANTITAGEIEAGSLTSASGVFGVIDAGHITTGTMLATRIFGGVISGVSLDIGSGLNVDTTGRMYMGASWAARSFGVDTAGDVYLNGRTMFFDLSGASGPRMSYTPSPGSTWSVNASTINLSGSFITSVGSTTSQTRIRAGGGGIGIGDLDAVSVRIGDLSFGSSISIETNNGAINLLTGSSGSVNLGSTGSGFVNLRGPNVRMPQAETLGSGWNMIMTSGGANEIRATGASRAEYKDVDHHITADEARAVLNLPSVLYRMKEERFNADKVAEGVDDPSMLHYGTLLYDDNLDDYDEFLQPLLIVDDLGEGRRVEGFQYSFLVMPHNTLLKDHDERLARLERRFDIAGI